MKKFILGASLVACSNLAVAGGYVGGGIGQAKVDIESENIPGYTMRKDETDTSVQVFGGYRASPVVAVEGGLINFGEGMLEYRSSTYYIQGTYEASAAYAAVLVGGPVGKASIYARAGLAAWELDATIVSNIPGASETISEDGVDPLFGIGAEFPIGPHFALRGEFTRFTNVGDENTTGESDVDVMAVSGMFRF